MTALQERQFELDGYVFGNGCPVFLDGDGGFDPGDEDVLTQDATNVRTGARVFGRDRRSAKTFTFKMHVNREDAVGAMEALEALAGVWVRDWETGEVTMLRYRIAGRERVVFGRPRRFSYSFDNRLDQGYLPPLGTFELSDSKSYSTEEQSLELTTTPPSLGGFTAPFAAPLSIDSPAGAVVPGSMVVGGGAKTAPVVEFSGPSTNPSVTIGAVVIGLNGSVPAGTTVIVDTRPWAGSLTKVGPAPGVRLAAKTSMSALLLPPGSYQAVYRATDYTGTSRARVRWRDAYATV